MLEQQSLNLVAPEEADERLAQLRCRGADVSEESTPFLIDRVRRLVIAQDEACPR